MLSAWKNVREIAAGTRSGKPSRERRPFATAAGARMRRVRIFYFLRISASALSNFSFCSGVPTVMRRFSGMP